MTCRKSGQPRWQRKFDDAVLGAIACHDGKLLCPVRNGEVVALDLRDGGVLWRRSISGHSPVLAGCAFTGSLAYVASSDGYLAVIDTADGKVLERMYLSPGVLAIAISIGIVT